MKDFLRNVLATIVGVIIINIVFFFFFISICAGLIASSVNVQPSVTSVPENAVLDINFKNISLAEQTIVDDPLSNLTFGGGSVDEMQNIGILDAVKSIEEAMTDPAIKLVYIRPDAAGNISLLEEFRAALVKFHDSGKPIIAYIETPTNAGFYLASAADRIYMSHYKGGMNMLNGISGQLIFLKDLLDRLGINVQLIRHGKYKSAGEMFIRSNASEENMEQNKVMISGLWSEMVRPMAERTGISEKEFNNMLDNLELSSPEVFLEKGLVDELVGTGEMKNKLCSFCGCGKYPEIQSISLADYSAIKNVPDYKIQDKIAVIYADGEIIDGDDIHDVASKRFVREIEKVRTDNDIKAVVLRVNSPGGSVTAASQIKEAIDTLAAEKPLVASYGSYAASGGYWISACCNHIFSDATTLTGSIGVFGMIPDFSGTLKNIAHVNITSVPSNAHSDMYSLTRALTADETSFIQKDIEAVYKEFVSIVAQGRKMETSEVDGLGQGRVWTGRDALVSNLVDSIGGLRDAIEYAASLSGSASYRVEAYPKPLTLLEQLQEQLSKPQNSELVKIKGMERFCGISTATVKTLSDLATQNKPTVYARIPYLLEIR